MRDYDNWKLSNGLEGEKVIHYCEHCGGEIYKGETYKYIHLFGTCVHEDCLSDYLLASIDANSEVAGEE